MEFLNIFTFLIQENLFETFQPEGTMEALLVEKIACLAWRQRRAVQAESSCFTTAYSTKGAVKVLKAFFKVGKVIAFKIFRDMKQILKRIFIGHCIN